MIKLLSRILSFTAFFSKSRKALNARMRQRFTPRQLAAIAAAVCMLAAILVLFVPPYLGVANDGTVSAIIHESGLRFLSDKEADNYGNYFLRLYGKGYAQPGAFTLHLLVIRCAKFLDDLLTRDAFFDVRFLALIYFLFYGPAVFLVIREALERVHNFSEQMVITVLGVIIFSDISLLTYFNSLYPDPLLLILMLYTVGFAMGLQREKTGLISIGLMTLSVCLLCLVRRHCFVVGICFVLVCFALLRALTDSRQRVALLMCSVLIMGCSVYSLFALNDEFTLTSKIHAMTRGVLLQSRNPEKSLQEFGIDGCYAMLTDNSLYDPLPQTREENPLLAEDFTGRYNTGTIGIYYLRHPNAAISMLDIGVKASFDLRRNGCGNYEKSAHMPEGAQSVFWSMYSIYKLRSAPRTIGYLLALILGFILMSGRKTFRTDGIPERFHYVYVCIMGVISASILANLFYIFLRSGDAQIVQYRFLPGICMDLLLYFVLSEVLYRLNILESDGDKK